MPQKSFTKIIIFISFLLSAVMGGYLIYFETAKPKIDDQQILANLAEKQKLATGEVAAFIYNKTPMDLPEVTFLGPDGENMTLTNFNGKVILVNLWATWCGPCRHEMPTLDNLQATLGSDKFEVVTINVDRQNTKGALEFFKETNVKHLKLYADPTTKAMRTLRARGLPLTLLIDKNGKQVGKLIGPAVWNSKEAINLIKAELN